MYIYRVRTVILVHQDLVEQRERWYVQDVEYLFIYEVGDLCGFNCLYLFREMQGLRELVDHQDQLDHQ